MGKIVVSMTVTNHADEIRAESGDIPAAAVRSVDLDGVIVDTGATTLALSSDVIARLGLPALEPARIRTASSTRQARRYRDATIRLLGREGVFNVVELPRGTPPLLGVIPLEDMGLEPDVREQRLRVLPMDTDDTYITVL